jgi:hypothetical protein
MVTLVPFPTTILSIADPSGSLMGSERGIISSCTAYMPIEEGVGYEKRESSQYEMSQAQEGANGVPRAQVHPEEECCL